MENVTKNVKKTNAVNVVIHVRLGVNADKICAHVYRIVLQLQNAHLRGTVILIAKTVFYLPVLQLLIVSQKKFVSLEHVLWKL